MLIDKEIKIALNQRNIGHYRNKGYENIMPKYKDKHYRWRVKVGTEIYVKVEDLTRYCENLINFKCDYCGKNFYKTAVNYFNTLNDNLPIKKDACEDCKNIKVQECNMLNFQYKTPFCDKEINDKCKKIIKEKYGVDNIFQLEETKEKAKMTMIDRYGVENYSQTKECQDKIKNTCLIKYGTERPSQNKEISSKVRKSLYNNGTTICSQQQKYIHDLFGGELNYPYYNASLDIAFPAEKIYCECDFGGHWLSIKLGGISEKDFKNNERRRWYSLFRQGWKEIRIISKTDKIPSDSKLLEMLSYAKYYLSTGHHYIKFDIDNAKIISSQFDIPYDYGKLRRIYKSKSDKQNINVTA